MNKYKIVYEENKKLDELFNIKHPPNDEIYRKNILELLVEIGELANETRCFKYWSIKPMSEKHIVLDEFADCVIMILMFMSHLDVSIDDTFDVHSDNDVVDQFIYLYSLCSKIKDNNNPVYIKNIFSNFIYLGKLLNYTDEDIIDACMKKINRNFERMESDFVY